MPMRDIKCLTCGESYEAILKSGDKPPPCRSCGSSKTVFPVTSPGGIKGSGSGWYGRGGTLKK